MDDVLGAVGGSKRTLYQHFASKEDLFASIIASASDRTLSAFQPEGAGDLRQILVDLGTRYLGMLVSRDGLAVYRAMVSEAAHLPNLTNTFFETGPGRLRDALVAIFRVHNRAGGTRVAHPEDAADHFIGMVRGNLHLAALMRNEIPPPELIARMVEGAVHTLLNGMMTRPAAKRRSRDSSARDR